MGPYPRWVRISTGSILCSCYLCKYHLLLIMAVTASHVQGISLESKQPSFYATV